LDNERWKPPKPPTGTKRVATAAYASGEELHVVDSFER
jgi:hypothetical protein